MSREIFDTGIKIGVLGGGQLGKMLCQEAGKLGIKLHILEKDDTFPAASVCPDMTYGDFKKEEDVYHFGKQMDIVTVEIEAVNTAALYRLERQGVKVYPQPHILDLIKDKGEQKKWYRNNDIATSEFLIFKDAAHVKRSILEGSLSIPFVQKTRKGGYDGQGVKIIRSEEDLNGLIDAPCLCEDLVDVKKELSVIVARNPSGEIKSFPVVEMEFHPEANLVEFLICPPRIEWPFEQKCRSIAEDIAQKMGIVGVLAVELFLTHAGQILVNEVAPRPHNSGHQTIEANVTSQYGQHLRSIMDLPLGSTALRCPSVMINLLGAPGFKGQAIYKGLDKALAISGVYPHIYGKSVTKPYRKMGHVTILGEFRNEVIKKAKKVKSLIKVISRDH